MSQHPHFELFKSAWKAADFAGALGHVDAVIADHPQVASLHWYRANCLEKLERYPEAAAAVAQVLALKPDHAPALLKQVELEWGNDDYDGDEEPTPKQRAALERQAEERRHRHVAQLRRAVAIDPTLADAWYGLSQLLRADGVDEGMFRNADADAMLAQAIDLAPDRIEFRHARADLHRVQAMQTDESTPDADVVTAFSGMRYLRAELEAALRDFAVCARLDGGFRYHVSMGRVLHDLGRYDEALASYDHALRLLPADAPEREFVEEVRSRSRNGGGGERDAMARLLEGAIGKGDRNLADDNAAQLMMAMARAVRSGKDPGEALPLDVDASPEDLAATNVALQILNLAYERPPALADVDAATFPAYQRQYAAKQRKALARLGVRHVADAEATGMTPVLGQRILLGLHGDEAGLFNVATFAMRPKWPGYVAFLLLFAMGKWKTHRLTECVTYFDDGGYYITQYENLSPFDYADAVKIEKLPRGKSVAALVERHRERVNAHRQANPRARVLHASDLAAVDANWRRGQAIKRAYRRSVGYVTDAELRGLTGKHYDRLGERIRGKIAELAPDYEYAAQDD